MSRLQSSLFLATFLGFMAYLASFGIGCKDQQFVQIDKAPTLQLSFNCGRSSATRPALVYSNSIRVNWQIPVGATSYEIRLNGKPITTGGKSKFTDLDAKSGVMLNVPTDINYNLPYELTVVASNEVQYFSSAACIFEPRNTAAQLISPVALQCNTSVAFEFSGEAELDYCIEVYADSTMSGTPLYRSCDSEGLFNQQGSLREWGTTLAVGSYYWTVKSEDSTITIPANGQDFRVVDLTDPVSAVSPTDGQIISTSLPNLRWSAGNPNTVAVEVSTSATDFSTSTTQVVTGSTTYAISAPLTNGVYYWRLRRINDACSITWTDATSFIVCATAVPTPSISAATICGNQNSTVSCSGDCTGVEYSLDSSTGPFSSTTTISGLTTGAHVWYARRLDPAGCMSSVVNSPFNVDGIVTATAPTIPSGGNPTGGPASYTGTMSWNALTNAPTGYEVELYEGSTTCVGTLLATLTTGSGVTSVSTGVLSPGTQTDYSWRVRARNNGQCAASAWSVCQTFTVTFCGGPAAPTINAADLCAGATSTVSCLTNCTDIEYSFDSAAGPFSATTSVTNVTAGSHTWYARVNLGSGCTSANGSKTISVSTTVTATAPTIPGGGNPAGGTASYTGTMSWNAVASAPAGYRVELYNGSTTCSGTTTFISTTASTSLSTGALNPGATTQYSWRVQAVENGLCPAGSWSACNTFQVTVGGCSQPSGGTWSGSITGNQNGPSINWTAQSGTHHYRVYFHDGGSCSWANTKTVAAGGPYTAAAGCDGIGCSGFDNIFVIACGDASCTPGCATVSPTYHSCVGSLCGQLCGGATFAAGVGGCGSGDCSCGYSNC